MATITKYTYSILNDTANSKVDSMALCSDIVHNEIIIPSPSRIDTSGDVLEIYMKDILSTEEETALDSVVAEHDGKPLVSSSSFTNSNGIPLVEQAAPTLPNGHSDYKALTHDFCDPRTWYQQSVKMTGQVLTDSGDHITYTYSGANKPWIDYRSPRLTNIEGKYLASDGNFVDIAGWKQTVYVDGIEVSEEDYKINFGFELGDPPTYSNCSIEFKTVQSASAVVTIDVWHIDSNKHSSLFEIRVPVGYKYDITRSEIQFSKGIKFQKRWNNYPYSLVFEIWGGNTQAVYDTMWGMKVPYCAYRYLFKSMQSFMAESAGMGKNTMPLSGSADMTQDSIEFPMPYTKIIPLSSITDENVSVLRMYMQNDKPLTNAEMATSTLWGIISPNS